MDHALHDIVHAVRELERAWNGPEPPMVCVRQIQRALRGLAAAGEARGFACVARVVRVLDEILADLDGQPVRCRVSVLVFLRHGCDLLVGLVTAAERGDLGADEVSGWRAATATRPPPSRRAWPRGR